MLYEAITADEVYQRMEKGKALCVFADAHFLNIFRSQYETGRHLTFDIVLIPMSETIAEEMQIIRVPQFRLFENGCERMSLVGKWRLSEVVGKVDANRNLSKNRTVFTAQS